MEEIRGLTLVTSPRADIVTISYRDVHPERAYEVNQAMSSLFIRETLATKERERREAYEFSDKQVQAYHQKHTDAEDNRQEYRARNADAQPGSATDVNARISALRTQVEQTRMSLLEQQSRAASISAQLSGESAVTKVQTRDTFHRARLIAPQEEIERLLLNLTDRHPPVLRVPHTKEEIHPPGNQRA